MAFWGEMNSVADIFAAILKAESRLPQGAQQHVSELRVWADNIHDHSLLELEGRLRFAPAAISMVRDLLTEFKRFVDTYHEGKVFPSVDDRDPKDILKSLQDLIPSLLDPVPHSRNVDEAWLDAVDDFPPTVDQHNIAERFPFAYRFLIERLGVVNALRRAKFAYSTRIYLDVSEGKSAHGAKDTTRNSRDSALENFLTTSGPISQTGSSYREEFVGNDDASSSTSSDADGSIADGEAAITTRIPDAPKEYWDNEHFECPYCHASPTEIRGHKAWKHHLFRDLEPYSCTFPDCRQWKQTFSRKRDWVNHERSSHAVVWSCPLISSHDGFADQSMLEHHMLREHSDMLSHQQISRIIPACRRRLAPDDMSQTCRLCQATFSNRKTLEAHVATEQEEIALSALPNFTDSIHLYPVAASPVVDPLSPDKKPSSIPSQDSNAGLAISSDPRPTNSILQRWLTDSEHELISVRYSTISEVSRQREEYLRQEDRLHSPTKANNKDKSMQDLTSEQLRGVSDHWTAAEVDSFPLLVEKYGTNWTAISIELKTKTASMVKNYFDRELSLDLKHRGIIIAEAIEDGKSQASIPKADDQGAQAITGTSSPGPQSGGTYFSSSSESIGVAFPEETGRNGMTIWDPDKRAGSFKKHTSIPTRREAPKRSR